MPLRFEKNYPIVKKTLINDNTVVSDKSWNEMLDRFSDVGLEDAYDYSNSISGIVIYLHEGIDIRIFKKSNVSRDVECFFHAFHR